jgi:hypothetical protein
MFDKLKAFLAKVDFIHFVLVLGIFAAAYAKEILALVGTVDPAFVAPVQKAIVVVVGLAALVKQASAKSAATTSSTGGQAGCASVRSLVLTATIGVLLALVVPSVAGCPGGPVAPNTVQTALTVEGYVCVLDQLADGLLPSGPALVVATAVQTACAANIPQGLTGDIVTIIDAFSAAGDAGSVDAGSVLAVSDPSSGTVKLVDRAAARAEAKAIRARTHS